jgi:hypothetical protein
MLRYCIDDHTKIFCFTSLGMACFLQKFPVKWVQSDSDYNKQTQVPTEIEDEL